MKLNVICTLVKALLSIILLGFIAILFACKSRPLTNVGRGFYYWKTNFNISPFEQKYMDSVGAQQVFVRFFDVDYSSKEQEIKPIALVRFTNTLPHQAIVPVIFITPRAINALQWQKIDFYAEKIALLLAEKCLEIQIDPKEVQIDCDWTANNKAIYFQLLKRLREQVFFQNRLISVTIRLHQVKYLSSTGVPPADRGLLMVYNMDKLDDPLVGNSIISEETAVSYLKNLSRYPLPLDIALPIYSWTLLFRNNELNGIIRNWAIDDFAEFTLFKNIDDNRFLLLKDTFFKGYDLRNGDILRFENSDFKTILSVSKHLSQQLNLDSTKVLFYHCDSINFSKYPTYELEKIFSCFH